MKLSFFAPGSPRPQGSSRAFVVKGRAIITSATKGLHGWREVIAVAAMAAGAKRLEGPVLVTAEFLFARPKSHYTGKGVLKGPASHASRPDLDKLCRALLDALTGVAWNDDSQVFSLHAARRWAEPGQPEGVRVVVVADG